MKGEKKNTVALVEDLVAPITEQLGLQLWDVRFEKEGASWFLRVIIDSVNGVTLDDCEAVSRPLSDLLDEKDFIAQSYYLEVSSPGLLRELKKEKHFAACEGEEVWVRLIRPLDHIRDFIGCLQKFSNGTFSVIWQGQTKTFAWKDCAFVKLYDDDTVPII